MGGGGGDGDGVTVVGRAEIDMRAPFRSVKEAVVLFGDRVLLAGADGAAQQRINRSSSDLKDRAGEMRPSYHEAVGVLAAASRQRHTPAVELQEAKQELEKERSEKQKMAGCILSLQEELGNAMRELKKLKVRGQDDDGGEAAAKVIDLQVEDLKFVEIAKQNQPANAADTDSSTAVTNRPDEFQKRRYVTFSDTPPTAAYLAPPQAPLPDVVMELHHHRHSAPAPPPPQLREVRFLRQMSAGHGTMKAAADQEGSKKKKKKALIPLVGALFMRKKKTSCCHDDSMLNPRTSF
ncbi:WEB family protein At2g17940-like [Oryza brachyantha]|uniref:WEB family protein At2g17940-like n=1 Tax=Oryza brachyantha TaxID=4533 RepID=UPI0003EAA6B3|nr:WEB family protein At2g17940-like [Oryza brachyantha]